MAKILTVSDAFWQELQTIVNGGNVTPPTEVPPPVIVTPPGVQVINVPFVSNVNRNVVRIPAGTTLAFRIAIPSNYNSGNSYCTFSTTPTGGADYFARNAFFSKTPGDFGNSNLAVSDIRLRFTVGGHVTTQPVPYIPPRVDVTTPMFNAGDVIYYNVKQVDPKLTCQIDWQAQFPGA